ncbi:MAG: right-handed parallel beta-helix repeat-containing protein [Kofleriaceae bacterium]
MRTSYLFAVTASLALASCAKDNPNYCDPATSADCTTDASIDAPPVSCTTEGPDGTCPPTAPVCNGRECTGCTQDMDCAPRGTTPVCVEASGVCGVCDDDDRQSPDVGGAADECPNVGTQVCDGTSHTCRACAVDSECASLVCDGGTCVASADVAYVAPGMTGNCDQATPCGSMSAALGANRPNIVVAAGTYDAGNTDIDINNRDVEIRATGATFQRTGNGLLLNIRGNSRVVVIGGTFDGTSRADHIIGCTGGTAMTLMDVTVKNSGAYGISGDCTMTIRQSTITTNHDGINVNAGTKPFTMTRSIVSNNAFVGATITAQTAVIMNNYIVKNGAGGANAALTLAVTMPGASRIEFNTIAENKADAATAGAVVCGASTTQLRNSIIFGNNGSGNEVSTCTVRFSTVEGATPDPGNGIIDATPMFISTATDNFHLMPASPVAGKADPMAVLTDDAAVDYDGESRPQGGAPADLGADEIP